VKHTQVWIAALLGCAAPETSEAPISKTAEPVTSPSGARLEAHYFSATGWVRPGESYPFTVDWAVGSAGASSAVVSVVLPAAVVFVEATPPPTSGTGTALNPLRFSFSALAPNRSSRIVITARSRTLAEDPEIMWKDLSANASLAVTTGLVSEPAISSATLGPKVTTHETARYGERSFPLVMVEY